MAAEPVLSHVRNYLKALADQGLPVAFAVMYGSQTKGTADRWSDIDLVVVSPRYDSPYTREEIDRLWITAAKVAGRIEPIPCGERQWEDDDSSALIEIARREGEIIKPV
jgi:predicted nucleotidyltransferase